ncbi:MAG TPA: phosphoribosylamine--glycine ligase [Chitinophagales bacterium]|nr:phosphoribosylamine--glycine ligase [Chitinophagales bacterium]
MKILLLGSGGREHAFAWKLTQSPLCEKLFIAPGNAGTSQHGENVAIGVNDFDAIREFVLANNIEMVVVGPEDPLVNGIYDYFLQNADLKNIPVIGPSKDAAQLEGSKAFAKQFMVKHNIPTAAYGEFTIDTLEDGFDFIDEQHPPIVLKADGLAAGKGVLIVDDHGDAKDNLREMIEQSKFGKASAKVVIEQFLKGIEFSVFVLTDGQNYKILPQAKDYKRIGEGDTGLNTGGMGCISPVPFVDEALMKKVEERVIIPTIEGLKKDGIVYKGFIYIGFMNVKGEPYVIEYNCRMGDPETEVVLPRLKNDLVDLLVAVGNGTLDKKTIEIDKRAAATVIVASGGYPEDYEKGKEITGLEDTGDDAIVFHAGTKADGDKIVTNGGRVLAVTSFGKTIQDAVVSSNKAIGNIYFPGKYYRKDIGYEFR